MTFASDLGRADTLLAFVVAVTLHTVLHGDVPAALRFSGLFVLIFLVLKSVAIDGG